MASDFYLRWLGTAGIELRACAQTLLIDPYVTRVSLQRMLFGTLEPDTTLLSALLPKGDIILVSHAHFDHLLDVPVLAQQSGARVFGSANTCQILRACGVAPGQIHQVQPGDHMRLGAFQVDVYSGGHERILGLVPYRGLVRSQMKPPLRAAEYRFDVALMYRVQVGVTSLLFTGNAGPAPDTQADVLLSGSTGRPEFYQALIQQVQPRVVVLIHWDNFWRPLSEPLQPISYRPIKVVDPPALARRLGSLAPGLRVLIPKALRDYSAEEICGV